MANSISEIYTDELVNQIVKDLLEEATSPTLSAVSEALEEHQETHTLTDPQFKKDTWDVAYQERSSATKFNGTFSTIHQDLIVLYKALHDINNETTTRFERWKSRASLLERRTNKLLQRISSVLLTTENTEGYANYFQENFNDLLKIDQTNTTARVDITHNHVSIGTTTTSSTKQLITSIQDISFSVLTSEVLGTQNAENSELRNIFDTTSSYWLVRIFTSRPITVSTEIKARLASTGTTISISRIDVDLHSQGTSTTVYPLYSEDGLSWKELPTTQYVLSVADTASFVFPSINAQWIKFVLTKESPDLLRTNGNIYEFGIDEISIFSEGFSDSSSGQEFISKPISITNQETGAIEPFSAVALEVCENVPDDTSIDYYLAVSDDSTVPINIYTEWWAIDSFNRAETTKPTVLNFSEVNWNTHQDIQISMDPLNSNSNFINPGQTFNLVSSSTGTATTTTSSSQRYIFFNPEDRILNYQFLSTIGIEAFEIWRNTARRDTNYLVRGVACGWSIQDDYYKCVVRAENDIEIDFGAEPILINEVEKLGRITIPEGRHLIQVHKDNWKQIDVSSITDLASLKTLDTLYPYNHRYLIEGISYPVAWSSLEEKIYRGFDTVAEYLMSEVSVLDVVLNIKSTDFQYYAIDWDADDPNRNPNSNGTEQTKVVLLKTDYSQADFLNERFEIRWRPSDLTYNYCRLRAVLKTTDTEKTPLLGSYRLKFAGKVV